MATKNDDILRLAEKLIDNGRPEALEHACKLLEAKMEHDERVAEAELRHGGTRAAHENAYKDVLDSFLARGNAMIEQYEASLNSPAQVVVKTVAKAAPRTTPIMTVQKAANSAVATVRHAENAGLSLEDRLNKLEAR